MQNIVALNLVISMPPILAMQLGTLMPPFAALNYSTPGGKMAHL
jgi:hypothetical protein